MSELVEDMPIQDLIRNRVVVCDKFRQGSGSLSGHAYTDAYESRALLEIACERARRVIV